MATAQDSVWMRLYHDDVYAAITESTTEVIRVRKMLGKYAKHAALYGYVEDARYLQHMVESGQSGEAISRIASLRTTTEKLRTIQSVDDLIKITGIGATIISKIKAETTKETT